MEIVHTLLLYSWMEALLVSFLSMFNLVSTLKFKQQKMRCELWAFLSLAPARWPHQSPAEPSWLLRQCESQVDWEPAHSGRNHSESKCRPEWIQQIPWNLTPEFLIVFHTLSSMQATFSDHHHSTRLPAHSRPCLYRRGHGPRHFGLRELTPDLHHSESLYTGPIEKLSSKLQSWKRIAHMVCICVYYIYI